MTWTQIVQEGFFECSGKRTLECLRKRMKNRIEKINFHILDHLDPDVYVREFTTVLYLYITNAVYLRC